MIFWCFGLLFSCRVFRTLCGCHSCCGQWETLWYGSSVPNRPIISVAVFAGTTREPDVADNYQHHRQLFKCQWFIVPVSRM